MTPVTWVLFLVLVLVFAWMNSTSGRRALRTHRIERKLDALLAGANALHTVYPPPSDRVRSIISNGTKADAIRAYREENPSVQLKDAHDVITALISPDRPRRADLGRVEDKINALVRAHGLDASTDIVLSSSVREHMTAGRLFDAVRALRTDNPSLSLVEARDIARGLRK